MKRKDLRFARLKHEVKSNRGNKSHGDGKTHGDRPKIRKLDSDEVEYLRDRGCVVTPYLYEVVPHFKPGYKPHDFTPNIVKNVFRKYQKKGGSRQYVQLSEGQVKALRNAGHEVHEHKYKVTKMTFA